MLDCWNLKGKRVLLTGGTGSFGIGFLKLLLSTSVLSVRVFSRNEHNQRRVREMFASDRLAFYIGDIRDKDRVYRALDEVDLVVHAAALKQAPLGEIEPQEFIKTNIIGSMNLVEACLDHEVEKVLLISSDKAVEPLNLYGATKMCAEKVFLQANLMKGNKRTAFSITRYGNVAGTSGSVIPYFLSLKEKLPVTDLRATRFWITLKEANEFVLNSLCDMSGGEVFIPPMRCVRILDLAWAVNGGEEPVEVGLRKGDKLHEVIQLNPRKTSEDGPFLSNGEIRDFIQRYRQDLVGTSL